MDKVLIWLRLRIWLSYYYLSLICIETRTIIEDMVEAVIAEVAEVTIFLDFEVLIGMINWFIEPYVETRTILEDIW